MQLSAIDAFAKTRKIKEDNLCSERSFIESKIEHAINNGYFECSVDKISEPIMSELISDGYEVEKIAIIPAPYKPYNPQIDGIYYTISWRMGEK